MPITESQITRLRAINPALDTESNREQLSNVNTNYILNALEILRQARRPGIVAYLMSFINYGLADQDNFNTLATNAQYAQGLGDGLSYLQADGILNQDNFNTLATNAQYAQGLGRGLSYLQRAGILDQDNRNTLATNAQYAHGLGLGLFSLQHAGILNQDNFNTLAANAQYAQSLGSGLSSLQDAGILNQDNFNTLAANAQYAQSLGDGLYYLQEARILNLDNRNTLAANAQYAQSLGRGLSYLQDAGILNQDNFNTLAANAQYVHGLGNGLYSLQADGILNQDNFNTLAANAQYADSLGWGLSSLQRAGILDQDNRNTLAANAQYADSLGWGLSSLQRAGILDQDNRNTLAANATNAQIIGQGLRELFETNRILVNQVNFTALVAQGENALNHAREIIRRAQPAQERQALPVADRQSTHLASVHRSVSDSATRLMETYGNQIQGDDLETTLQAIRDWSYELDESEQSVKDCINRLTAIEFTFSDPGSGVTMHQLLALTWKALHDEDKLQGSLEDGLEQFAEGLNEIQNEYGPGSPACTGGTFNKIIEKLVGIHRDAEQIVITPQQATAKLQSVVKEEAYKHLYSLASPETKVGLKAFTDLIEKIKEDGIEVIWDNIKDNVAIRMIDEFGSIYNNSKDDARFQGLLAGGVYVDLDELDKFQEQISQSKGYNEFMKSVIRHSAASTQQSPEEPATSPGGKTRVSDLWVA